MAPQTSARGFIYVVYLFLSAIWFASMALPAWRPLPVLLPFTLLTLIHGVLHGQMEVFANRGWAWPYVLVQTALASAMLWAAGGGQLVEGLYVAVAAEGVGLFGRSPRRWAAVSVVAATWALMAGLVDGWSTLVIKLPWVAGAYIFAIVYVVIFMGEAEARERTERLLAELEEAHRQLRSYARQVQELTITEERHRMARELHDTLAQGLVGLIMQLEAVDDLLGRGEGERARSIVQRAMERARQTLAEARTTVQALRLPLERGDLLEELRRMLDRAGADGSFQVALEVGPGSLPVDDEVALQLYRIAQEALANIVRHAHASRVTLRLWSEGESVSLSIADDGVGFDPSEAVGRSGHFGLAGMQERVRLTGGSLAVDSRPGHGARITATIPRRLTVGEGAR